MQATHIASRFGGHNSVGLASRPLTDEDIMRKAPSVFADSAHDSRSARYEYVPTIQLVRGLRREGFEVFAAMQSGTRKEGHEGYTKHLLRLRHADERVNASGDSVNDVLLLNSHNGTSSTQLIAGVFRSVCTNSLVCGSIVEDIRVHHKRGAVQDVIEGAFKIFGSFDVIDESKDAFRTLQLSSSEQALFAEAAMVARFDVMTPDEAPVRVDQVLQARRREDAGDNLWEVFNRVQENLVQGGLRGRTKNKHRIETRPVAGIEGNTALNRALWMLAEGMRAAKSAS